MEEKILEIMRLAMKISAPGVECKIRQCFVEYTPHVAWLKIEYYDDNYHNGSALDYKIEIYLTHSDAIENLDAAISKLENIANE